MREAAIGAAATFALHWLWENAQAFLFKGYAGFAQHLWMCTVGTFGDLAIVAIMYGVVALLWRDYRWHRHGYVRQYFAAIVVGVGIAVLIEYRALATGRWAYDGMPLVPFTGIGLLPILQMAILPPCVFRLMAAVARGTVR